MCKSIIKITALGKCDANCEYVHLIIIQSYHIMPLETTTNLSTTENLEKGMKSFQTEQ